MKQQNILSLWRNVEIFNLPDFNKECFLLKPNSVFPWEEAKPLRNPELNVWSYTLVFGRLQKKDTISAIESLLNSSDNHADWEEPVAGDTCLSALLLDKDGQPDHKSYVPAAFVFGINCLEKDVSIATVSEKLVEAQSDFEIRYNIPPFIDNETERKGSSITWLHLQEEINHLRTITKGWNKATIHVFAIAKEIPKSTEPDTSFLNSFYLNDLNTLIDQNKQGYGNALKQYLSITVDQKERQDLIESRALLCKSISPDLMPMARWPSTIANGLYTAQTGAVNTALADLHNEAGIKGINGPPGTGKTTLLLDIIANVVTSRAMELMKTGSENLFSRFTKIEKEGGFSGYFGLTSDSFCDSGILVASNNNAAVENITKTLPSANKIDRKEFNNADYFASYAQRLIEEESWGTLSAALGNAQNRNNFKLKFWLDDKEKSTTGFHSMLLNIHRDADGSQIPLYRQKFRDTKTELEMLVEKFELFKQTAVHFHNQHSNFQSALEEKLSLETVLNKTEAIIQRLLQEEHYLASQISETDEMIRLSENMLNNLNVQKPSLFYFHKLFNTSGYKKWRSTYDQNANRLEEYVNKKVLVTQQINSTRSELTQNVNRTNDLKGKLNSANKIIEQYFELRERLHVEYEIDYLNIVDDDFYTAPLEQVHLRTPYSSSIVNKLRSDIFLKSLDLHRYCILSNAKEIRSNLSLFFEMLEGRALVKPSVAKTLWGTLFLCVPVISTTLASVSRLFASMGKESIGWLLLDEAGQATPQSAAGMIWRSKRCVIVGDPLQIEPVVTIPSKLIFKLRDQEGVDRIWSPSDSSVQILADRVSQKGTYMKTGESDEEVWTGFPLRTHRRCDNPMFYIANQIAYLNQMVKATVDSDEGGYIGRSAWFHIIAKTIPVNKHVLMEELDLLEQKINTLRSGGYTGEIFVISPFKSVANACESIYRYVSGVSCGTIHRFQGKEADVVFLVLGGNPASQGARNWASNKPNMLNVALTRAKKRFYVIGNKNLWGKCKYFDVMASRL